MTLDARSHLAVVQYQYVSMPSIIRGVGLFMVPPLSTCRPRSEHVTLDARSQLAAMV
jgi:hypothetical protein